ncbi:peptidase dimerization domain-containing protein [Mycobacterium sp. 236(2023)]|uniref:M20 family metallopeptidase n=1 Tax=Mycobacterium sp. 236(2023) TaxID=3038163 RepID=UPI002414EBC1|nr:peptidase dimerization domain-containing protein [Mycobacterium sp. 236(2023)]MDG4663775.1 peptidase dimerization domain-containing protein [Mycobacterium sp. 236(2023)]
MVDYLETTLLHLVRTDTAVPAGSTEISPGDPRLRATVGAEILPVVEALGPDEIRRHPCGDIAARFGPDTADGVLLQTYIVSQHGNLMADPHDARIVDGAPMGLEGPAVVGQGANQNKGPMAAALAAVRGLSSLRRPVWLTVNCEGSSSHDGSRRIYHDLGVTAAHSILAFGTNLRVSLGNRGRIDVHVAVSGASSHSSQPELGRNPIPPAAAVVGKLATTPLPSPHPDLGPATATPYQFQCDPIAPHTLPSTVRVVVDRRLLPGEDPADAVAALRDHLDGTWPDLDITVGASMFPAQVDISAPVVTALAGFPTMYSRNAFDAGYGCSLGVPTVMFGPGRRDFGAGVVATEAVSMTDCRTAAAAFAEAARTLCG